MKKFNWQRAGLIFIIVYISVLNIFVIKATPEVIFLQFIVVAAIYSKTRTTRFIKDWIPFIFALVLYEALRGFADNLAPFGQSTLFIINDLEYKIFNGLPTIFLQQRILHYPWILNIALLFYSTFFYYPFLTGLLIWILKYDKFKDYFVRFMAMSFTGLFFYWIFPTAPPWFVENIKHLGIARVLYENTILSTFANLSIYRYFVLGNEVAAFPSLHTAWTAMTSIYLIKNFGTKYILTLIIPIMVGFSVVLTGEHYLLDVIAGFILAACFVILKLPRKKTYTNPK